MLRAALPLSKSLLLIAFFAGCSPARESELWLGGDVNVGSQKEDALGPLAEILGGAPLFVNLEGPVTNRTDLPLGNTPAAVEALAPLVSAAGVANNHALDGGAYAPEETIALLRGRRITPAGGSAGPAIIERGGVRWVVAAHDLAPGVPPPASLAQDLRAARAKGDVLVATFHVNGDPLYLPVAELRSAVDTAILEGADVVASTGTHVIGPVERRGKTIVAWGLGNLLFRCECTHETEGFLLRLRKRGARLDAEVVPIQAGLAGAPARPSPAPETMLDLLDAISPAALARQNGRAVLPALDARTGRPEAHQAPENQR